MIVLGVTGPIARGKLDWFGFSIESDDDQSYTKPARNICHISTTIPVPPPILNRAISAFVRGLGPQHLYAFQCTTALANRYMTAVDDLTF